MGWDNSRPQHPYDRYVLLHRTCCRDVSIVTDRYYCRGGSTTYCWMVLHYRTCLTIWLRSMHHFFYSTSTRSLYHKVPCVRCSDARAYVLTHYWYYTVMNRFENEWTDLLSTCCTPTLEVVLCITAATAMQHKRRKRFFAQIVSFLTIFVFGEKYHFYSLPLIQF